MHVLFENYYLKWKLKVKLISEHYLKNTISTLYCDLQSNNFVYISLGEGKFSNGYY